MSVLCWLLAGAVNFIWFTRLDELPTRAQLVVPVITVALIALGAALRAGALSGQEQRRAVQRALWAVLVYYLALLTLGLFFGVLFHLDRSWGGAVQTEPFRSIRSFLVHYRRTGSLSSLANLLGNIALLFPLGVLLPLMFRPLRHFWIFLPLAAAVPAGIEVLQYLTRTGVADVDDFILNFIGAALGYFITRLCQMLYGCWRGRA